jgi:hypothetical protein
MWKRKIQREENQSNLISNSHRGNSVRSASKTFKKDYVNKNG